MAIRERIIGAAAAEELPAESVYYLQDQAASDLATSLWLTGFFESGFRDPLAELDADAYQTIRRTDYTAAPILKLGRFVASRTPVWRAADGMPSDREQALNKITEAIPKLRSELAQGVWAVAEGVRYWWLSATFDEDLQAWVPMLSHRLKQKAGGLLFEDGKGNILQAPRPGEPAKAPPKQVEARVLPRRRVIVFRPGAGTNPEGNVDVGWMLFSLARAGVLNDKNDSFYARRHGAPWAVLQASIQGMRPGDVPSRLKAGAEKMTGAQRAITSLPLQDVMSFVEPNGSTAAYLGEREARLFRRAHMLVLANVLTSFTNESGPTGSSAVHEGQQETVEDLVADSIAEAISVTLRDFIFHNNPGVLALPGGGERFFLERQEDKADGLEVYDRGVALDADEFYAAIGWQRPDGVPDVIQKQVGFSFDTGGDTFGDTEDRASGDAEDRSADAVDDDDDNSAG